MTLPASVRITPASRVIKRATIAVTSVWRLVWRSPAEFPVLVFQRLGMVALIGCLVTSVFAASTVLAQSPLQGAEPGQPSAVAPGQDWWARAPLYRSNYYNIKTDLEPDDAKIMAEHMDATFAAYWGLFSRLPVRLQRPATLDLYMFANQQDYTNVLALRFNDDATGSWGKCITSGKSISLVGWKGKHSLEDLKRLFQHEGFHQVSSHLFTGTPLWAEEGMAELFERGIVVGDQLVVGDFPPRDKAILVKAIEGQHTMPLERFLAIGHDEWGARVKMGDAQVQYLQAWSLIHFLVFAENGKYEMPYLNFLVQLNRRVPWQQAFVASFGVPDVKALETKWSEYVHATPPSDYRETLRRLDFLAAGMAALRAKEVYPTSMAELQAELERIGFEHESNLPGGPQRMSARDAALFMAPFSEEVAGREFVLIQPRAATGGDRTRQEPPPMTIVAQGLYPQVFLAEWVRRGREAGYALSAKPSSQYNKTRATPTTGTKRTDRGSAATIPPVPGVPPTADTSGKEPALPPAIARTWTSADGKFTTVAKLAGYSGGVAQLRRADGTVIKVRREQLSATDRAFLDGQERNAP